MFGVAGASPASTAGEAVLTVRAAVTELLTEVPGGDARTRVVAWLSRVVAGLVVVLVGGLAI